MSLQILACNRDKVMPEPPKEVSSLRVSEFFCDTIQGEGVHTGVPATFLRLQGCTLNCTWCDSKAIHTKGDAYTFVDLFRLIESADLIRKWKEGQHLVVTGGSPLLQQESLYLFLKMFRMQYNFLPYIEVENECVIKPIPLLCHMVNCWNNSPKLSNSGNRDEAAYKEDVLLYMSHLRNSWFKFVVSDAEDWAEINEYYLKKGLIRREQVILMPQGATREELLENREFVVYLAVKHNVRYSTREHVILWDCKSGV
jgi:7-carboxy-7-deazaguanine synthase